jgi:SAM-dependent methyltransferase
MHYDPIKKQIGFIFNCCRTGRVVFFHLLDILLLRSWYVRREVRKWKKTAPAGTRVLDAGSGFGQYVYFLSGLGKKLNIKGIDVKEEEIAVCEKFFGGSRSGGRVKFEKADLTTFVEPGEYDLVLCIDVLEHISNDTGVMKNLCESMKPGGMLIISTPSDQGGSDVHEEGDSSFIGEHVRDGYGSSEIREKLVSSGFSSVELIWSYGRWGQLSWRLSMKYPINMLNKGRVLLVLLPFYYLITLPFFLLFNFLDMASENKSGTGLIVKAVK